jgi:hypothetical protein
MKLLFYLHHQLCYAGMGSSAMGASMLRNKFKKAGISDVNVTNTAINLRNILAPIALEPIPASHAKITWSTLL